MYILVIQLFTERHLESFPENNGLLMDLNLKLHYITQCVAEY